MKLGQDCYIIRDANGYALAYVYFGDEPGRRSAAHLLTNESWRVASIDQPRTASSVLQTTRLNGRNPWRYGERVLRNCYGHESLSLRPVHGITQHEDEFKALADE
jgi:hypothetical protein